jgi:hypothetical protein
MPAIDRFLPSLFGPSVLACALAVGLFFHQPWALAAGAEHFATVRPYHATVGLRHL